MIPILYESTETAFETNGIGRLRDCIECRVVEERNSIYECDFSYPVGGAHYDEIKAGRIIGVTHDESGDVQPFDIVGYSRPIDGIVTFHAVHISYRLTGVLIWSKNVGTLSTAIDKLNLLDDFEFSTDFVSTAWCPCFDGIPRSARQLMGGVDGSIIDTYGGEWEFNKWEVILHKARGHKRDFAIRYGINLSDYKEDTDFSQTYNAVKPFWTDGNGVIVLGDGYKSDDNTFTGRRIMIPLDLSDKFETKPTVDQLNSYALNYVNTVQTTIPNQTIAVDFIRLQDSTEYASLAPLLSCGLCDTINVVFPMYGMEGRFKIVKTVWDVLADRYAEMELGTLSTSLSEALGVPQPKTDQVITDMTIYGGITVGGHSSQIGTIITGTRESTAGTSTTSYTTAAHVDLTAGTWHIYAFNSFNGGTAGTRRVLITSNSSATTDAGVGSSTGYAPADIQIVVRSEMNVTISSNTTYYLRIRSGTSVSSPYGNISAVRIA